MAALDQSTIDRLLADPRMYPITVFAVALAVGLGYLAEILQRSYDIRTPPDTTTYLQTCDFIFSDPAAIIGATKGPQYLGFTVPFCAVDQLTGGNELAWVLVQVFLSAITAVLVYSIAKRVANRTAGLVAGFAFAILFDTLRFTVFMLSETVFTFALVLSIWALVRYRPTPTRRGRLLVFFSLGFLAITRPFGPPIVAGWLLLEALPRDSDYRNGFLPRPVAIATLVAIPVALLLFSSAPGKLAQMEQGWREGWILWQGRSEFFLAEFAYTPRPAESVLEFVVFNVDHIAIMGILRTLVFFVPLTGGVVYSTFWIGVNAAVLTPLIVLSFFGLVRARRSNPALLSVVAIPLIVVVAIVAVTFISLAWRYRAPLGPVFAILAGSVVGTSPRIERLIDWVNERVG